MTNNGMTLAELIEFAEETTWKVRVKSRCEWTDENMVYLDNNITIGDKTIQGLLYDENNDTLVFVDRVAEPNRKVDVVNGEKCIREGKTLVSGEPITSFTEKEQKIILSKFFEENNF